MAKKAAYVPRLKKEYVKKFRPALQKELKKSTIMAVPTLEKIVVNIGVGEAIRDKKLLDAALEDIATVTGQRGVATKARKSIANFKLRQGMPIGAMVTLRGNRMYEFLDRLINVAIPRIKDFRGINPKSFDGRGNYSFGVDEQIIFPEIDYDKIAKISGMSFTFATTAANDEEGKALLEKFGMPFRK